MTNISKALAVSLSGAFLLTAAGAFARSPSFETPADGGPSG
ncbi:hypothetical protein AB7M17_007999 [Bradyrhizobium sp. USDA 377]